MKKTLLVFLIAISCLCCAKKEYFESTPLADTGTLAHTLAYPDTVIVQAGKHYAHGRFYSFLFGKHYRKVWTAPVPVRVLNLRNEKGGLKITKAGGSMQTTSYTLEDKNGLEYALRSVDKDPAGSLPKYLKGTIIADFMRDQTAALNPYAALIVAPLAKAAKIPHAKPELVYLPADTLLLGKYAKKAGNKLYMLEEKLNHKRVLITDTASVSDIVSTKKLLKKRFSNNKHQVDQLAFAKARLFDLFLNDRDRHQEQWNWSEHKIDGTIIYRPIPKDRDQALYKFANGLIPRVFGRGLNYQKFISFRQDFEDLEALSYKSSYIDRLFLAEVSESQFDSLAKELKSAFTDEVIEQAVQVLPEKVYAQIGASTTNALKKRRDLLQEAARSFYTMLANEVSVVGSDEQEHFIVKRLDNETTEIDILQADSGKLVYHRSFKKTDTDKIELFGLGDKDTYEVIGNAKKGIKIIIHAAPEEDTIKGTTTGKKILIRKADRSSKPDAVSEKGKKKIKASSIPEFNRTGND